MTFKLGVPHGSYIGPFIFVLILWLCSNMSSHFAVLCWLAITSTVIEVLVNWLIVCVGVHVTKCAETTWIRQKISLYLFELIRFIRPYLKKKVCLENWLYIMTNWNWKNWIRKKSVFSCAGRVRLRSSYRVNTMCTYVPSYSTKPYWQKRFIPRWLIPLLLRECLSDMIYDPSVCVWVREREKKRTCPFLNLHLVKQWLFVLNKYLWRRFSH